MCVCVCVYTNFRKAQIFRYKRSKSIKRFMLPSPLCGYGLWYDVVLLQSAYLKNLRKGSLFFINDKKYCH